MRECVRALVCVRAGARSCTCNRGLVRVCVVAWSYLTIKFVESTELSALARFMQPISFFTHE